MFRKNKKQTETIKEPYLWYQFHSDDHIPATLKCYSVTNMTRKVQRVFFEEV